MRLGRDQQRVIEGRQVLRVQAKLRHLKLQQLKQFLNSGMDGNRDHVELIPSEDAGEGSVLNAEVLDQRGIARQCGADLFERNGRGDQAGFVSFCSRCILDCAQQVGFAGSGLLLELVDAFVRALFRTQLFTFDQVVIPVQFLAEIADRSHQVALTRVGGGGNVHGLHQQIHQGAGFRLFDVSESLLVAVGAAETEVDKVFVDFEFVLEESDFQLLAAQLAADVFHGFAGAAIGLIGRVGPGTGALDFAHQELGLIEQERRVDLFQDAPSRAAVAFGGGKVVHAQGDSGQKQFGEYSLALHGRGTEIVERGCAQALGFEEAAFVKQNECFVKVD